MVMERTSFSAFIKLHATKPDCPQYTWGKLLSSEDFMHGLYAIECDDDFASELPLIPTEKKLVP